jgi:hypothetical protein
MACTKISSLWLHAGSVVVLLDMASTTTEEAGNVAMNAEQNGSGTAARAVHEPVKKLGNQSGVAVRTLCQRKLSQFPAS